MPRAALASAERLYQKLFRVSRPFRNFSCFAVPSGSCERRETLAERLSCVKAGPELLLLRSDRSWDGETVPALVRSVQLPGWAPPRGGVSRTRGGIMPSPSRAVKKDRQLFRVVVPFARFGARTLYRFDADAVLCVSICPAMRICCARRLRAPFFVPGEADAAAVAGRRT